MKPNRSLLGWGVFLILAGAVPLAARSGYLTNDQIGRLWQLWPLILIGIGLGLVLSRTRFDLIGGLVVAATLGLMVGGLLAGGLVIASGGPCATGNGSVSFADRAGAISTSGAIDLQLDCGDLNVSIAPGDGWQVGGKSSDGKGPDLESTGSSLRVQTARDAAGPFWVSGLGETWQVTLPGTPRLDIEIQLNAGKAIVDLAGATVGTLDLQANAGSVALDLTSVASIDDIDVQLNAGSLGVVLPATSMTGSIHANAGSVRLCAPPGTALRFSTGESFLSGYDYAGHGLVQNGTTWTTPGFDDAALKIDLETVANAGSFTLDPEAGCG